MLPRAHFRSYARQPVKLAAVASDSLLSWERPVRIVNLGFGGACLELMEPPPLGINISLRIEAPHLWDPLTLDASVVWASQQHSRSFRAGVEFQRMNQRSLHAVLELLPQPGGKLGSLTR